MAFATINYFSRALEKASSFNIVFPDDPAISKPWSVFYLLHGLSDDHTTWMRRTSIERYVADLPLVVVMPDGGRGWYSNAQEGYRYEDDLIQDVVGLVDRTFPVKAERSGRCIGGLSMGGYGAVKIGIKHHAMFASVNSHSGTLEIMRDPLTWKDLGEEFVRIFGKKPADGPEDPYALVKELDKGSFPALRMDCGEEDVFLPHNRSFHEYLDELQIKHEYEEFSGGHDWAYWDQHIEEAIAFHVKTLNLKS